MNRLRWLTPLVLLFVPPMAALAQDPTAMLPQKDLGAWLMDLGPIGALVWGAYLLGKGVNITLTHKVELAEDDRKRVDEIIDTLKLKARSVA